MATKRSKARSKPLPKQVQDQQQRVEDYYASQQAAAEAQPAEQQPAEAQSAEPVQGELHLVGGEGTKPEDPREDDIGYWKQKYKTLEGMYQAQVPELQSQVGRLEQTLASLEMPSAVDPATVAGKQYLTKEEVEDYGPEMVEVMKKAAREAVSSELDALKVENERLREMLGQVSSTAQETARDGLVRALTAAVPDWEKQNQDPEFLAWLQQRDLYSGQTRQELLVDAYSRNDAQRVIAFFKAFREENPANMAEGSPVPQPGETGRPKVSMESLVAPGGPGEASVPANAASDGQEWFSRREIAQFYADVRKGKYQKDPEKRRELEERIVRAASEGRVTA